MDQRLENSTGFAKNWVAHELFPTTVNNISQDGEQGERNGVVF